MGSFIEQNPGTATDEEVTDEEVLNNTIWQQ